MKDFFRISELRDVGNVFNVFKNTIKKNRIK